MSDEKKAGDDVLLPGPPGPDGSVPFIHYREDGVFLGKLSPLRHGKTMSGPPVELHKHEDRPGYWVEWHGEKPVGAGPAMVNSKSYKKGWDEIFSKEKISPTIGLFGTEMPTIEA